MQNEVGGGATNTSERCLSALLPGVENRWGGWGAQIRKRQSGGAIFKYLRLCSLDGRETAGSAARGHEKIGKARNPHQPCPALAVLALNKYCSPNERTDFNQTRCLQRAAGGSRHAHYGADGLGIPRRR